MTRETTGKDSDILSSPLLSFILYWVPIIAMVASGNGHVSQGWRTGIWTASLIVMGAACLVNARRCGRTHCYLTGPFLLVMALGTLLYGLGVISLGAKGWNLLTIVILTGAIVLCCASELLLGKYRRG